MLTGSALSMDAFENLHAVWKWPSNHRKTVSAFLIFLLPSPMAFTVLLDTVPLPLNHLMWWLGSLICSSDLSFSDITFQWGKKKTPNKPLPLKTTIQPKTAPWSEGVGSHCVTQAARAEVQLFDFCKMQGVTLFWLKPFCLALCWSKAGSSAGWGWKKSDQKVLATGSWHTG